MIKPNNEINKDIVIANIDNTSLWILERPDYLSKIIKLIGEIGQAKIIGMDILFDDLKNPDPRNEKLKNLPLSCPYEPEIHPYEMKLACTINSPALFKVILSSNIQTNNSKKQILEPIKALKESAWGVGSILLPKEPSDQNYYKSTLYFEDAFENSTYSLPVMIMSYIKGNVSFNKDILTIANDKINYTKSIDGLLYFIPRLLGPNQMFKYISFKDIIKNKGNKAFYLNNFKDKIVLIGSSSESLGDLKDTPLTKFFTDNTLNGLMPAIELHANAIVSLMNKNGIVMAPLWLELLWGLIFVFLATVFIMYFKTSYSYLFNIILACISFLLGFLILTEYSILLPVGSTLIIILLIIPMAYIYKYLTIDKFFGKYVSPDVSKLIWKNKDKLILKGQKQFATIVFTDVRGFTTLSEKMDPETVLHILNLYFEKMSEIVYKTGGNLNKFIGDGLMILYGVPMNGFNNQSNAVNALLAAEAMLKELQELNTMWQKQNSNIKIDIGIGIHSGEVIAGNIGSTQRMEFSVIGDNVNLAARIEKLNKNYQTNIIMSESTYILVRDTVKCKYLNTVQVKGRQKEVKVYTVLQDSEIE